MWLTVPCCKTPTPSLVADRIRVLLGEIPNQNQSELARRCGLDRMDIYRYVRGENLPGAEHLAAIAHGCGVSVDWLLGLTDVRTSIEQVAGWVDDDHLTKILGDLKLRGRFVPYGPVGGNVRLVSAAELDRIRRQVDEREQQGRRRKSPRQDR